MKEENHNQETERRLFDRILKYTGVFGSVQGVAMIVTLVLAKVKSVMLGTAGYGMTENLNRTADIVKNATNKDIAREVYQLNPLIPEQVTLSVIENICQAAANLMSMGHAVTLQSKGRAALRIYPDVSLRGRNITLARAQQLDDTITELTTANAGDLVSRVGVRVRVRAACQPAFAKLLQDAGISTQRKDTINMPKILQGGSTPSGGGTSGGTTPSGSGDDPNAGND